MYLLQDGRCSKEPYYHPCRHGNHNQRTFSGLIFGSGSRILEKYLGEFAVDELPVKLTALFTKPPAGPFQALPGTIPENAVKPSMGNGL